MTLRFDAVTGDVYVERDDNYSKEKEKIYYWKRPDNVTLDQARSVAIAMQNLYNLGARHKLAEIRKSLGF